MIRKTTADLITHYKEEFKRHRESGKWTLAKSRRLRRSILSGWSSTTGLWEPTTEDGIKWQFGLDLKRAADEAGIDQFLWKRTSGQLSSFVSTLRGLIEKRDLRDDQPKLRSFHPVCPLAFDPTAE